MTDIIHARHSLADLDEVTRAEVVARAFWALGNPVRMRIVDIVMEEGQKGRG